MLLIDKQNHFQSVDNYPLEYCNNSVVTHPNQCTDFETLVHFAVAVDVLLRYESMEYFFSRLNAHLQMKNWKMIRM